MTTQEQFDNEVMEAVIRWHNEHADQHQGVQLGDENAETRSYFEQFCHLGVLGSLVNSMVEAMLEQGERAIEHPRQALSAMFANTFVIGVQFERARTERLRREAQVRKRPCASCGGAGRVIAYGNGAQLLEVPCVDCGGAS